MKTTQDAFHPMRGHVADGCEITMRNGDVLTLRATMQGWQLVDAQGRPYWSRPTRSAHVVDCLVYVYPSEEI